LIATGFEPAIAAALLQVEKPAMIAEVGNAQVTPARIELREFR
jgi:hypothetical protein